MSYYVNFLGGLGSNEGLAPMAVKKNPGGRFGATG